MAENNVIVSKKSKIKRSKPPALHFAIRIRGAPGMKGTILDTLKMLRMHRVNHGVLIWGEMSSMGMLKKVKDYIAYGEIDEKTLLRLLRARGRLEGNKPLTDEHIKNLTKYKDLKEFSKALLSGEIKYNTQDVYRIKPVFRLHPPRKGHRGTIKRHYHEGGTLGYVDQFINELIHKMM
ncbi:MAG: 50S ribosomal protein L30 [Candidatus Lokiarchaeota archaeon]|nr:50S ribosomal protein L30 [Candidatus Lokiarchaeota archaeon]